MGLRILRKKLKFPELNEQWNLSYRLLEKEQLKQRPISLLIGPIGDGGICFPSEKKILPNTMIALNLFSDVAPYSILAFAEVVCCQRKNRGYSISAEFWWTGLRNFNAQQEIANCIVYAIDGPEKVAATSK